MATLTAADAALFIRLHVALLVFVNRKLGLVPGIDSAFTAGDHAPKLIACATAAVATTAAALATMATMVRLALISSPPVSGGRSHGLQWFRRSIRARARCGYSPFGVYSAA